MGTKKYLDAFDNAKASKNKAAIGKATLDLYTQLGKGLRDESDPTSKGLTVWGHNQIVSRLTGVLVIADVPKATVKVKPAKKVKKARAKAESKSVFGPVVMTVSKRAGYNDTELCLLACGYTHDGQRPSFSNPDQPWSADRDFVGSSFTAARGKFSGGNPRLERPESFDSAKYQELRKAAALAALAEVSA